MYMAGECGLLSGVATFNNVSVRVTCDAGNGDQCSVITLQNIVALYVLICRLASHSVYGVGMVLTVSIRLVPSM